MTERSKTPFTNEHFSNFCLQMIGQPYWYGTVVYNCTENLLSRKAKQCPSHYGSERMDKYKRDILSKKVSADCVGGCKGYAWTGGGKGVLEAIGTGAEIKSEYGGYGCPDKSANGMFSYAKSQGAAWGNMASLPDLAGLALHKDGHLGYTVGGGYAVEWRGFSYGCVKTKISDRGWTSWFQLPFIDYGEGIITDAQNAVLGSRLLQNGMKGEDVRDLQEILMMLGYALAKYGADGEFGRETENALIAFQAENGILATGIYGETEHRALMDAKADDEDGRKEEAENADAENTEAENAEVGNILTVISNGGKVNIRMGNNTSFKILTAVNRFTRLKYIATAKNGWHAVDLGDRIGWISGEYSMVESAEKL
ncbi:MAG: peptidoglycan-binding protein [Clostridia bacterium]|nr:peptidoglycan-binding protein [Clostridia bacterium]